MTTTQPPACGKISDERLRQLRTAVLCMPLDDTEARDLLAIIDAYRHPAPVADERANDLETLCETCGHLGVTPEGWCVDCDWRRNGIKVAMAYRALSAQPSGALEREKGDYIAALRQLHAYWLGSMPRNAVKEQTAAFLFDLLRNVDKYCQFSVEKSGVLCELRKGHDGACGFVAALSPPPERAPGGDAASYHWGNPPFPRWPAETVDSMAEIGEAFMEALPKDYSWCQSPSEIIADLQNQLDDASATPPPSSSPSATADATSSVAIATLRAALEKDAARYRWLRAGGDYTLCCTNPEVGQISGDDLDAVIDGARNGAR